MKRRDLLRTAGAAMALSLLPREANAAWDKLLAGYRPAAGFSPDQATLVSALADAILPRTETPGALDVGVPAWVDLIVAEYYDDEQRRAFLDGLDSIEAHVRDAHDVTFAELDAGARDVILTALDRPADPQTAEARAFARLKGLVVHGYFTSEHVQKYVLNVMPIPGRFDADVPMSPPRPI